MKLLLAVLDSGSLSAAGRKLDMPLASVSRNVAELERYVGARLLMRTSRNIQLTDAGRDYADAIRQIIDQIEEAERRASGEYDEPRGELTITMPIEFGRLVVLSLAVRFLDDHPEISLNILCLDRLVQLVEERVDVAIRVGHLADSSLYAMKVGEVDLLTCASPSYLARKGRPVHPEELVYHDGVIFGPLGEAWWQYESNGVASEGKPRPRVRVNTASASVAAAVNGVGVTRSLNFQVADELRTGALVRVLEGYDGAARPSPASPAAPPARRDSPPLLVVARTCDRCDDSTFTNGSATNG